MVNSIYNSLDFWLDHMTNASRRRFNSLVDLINSTQNTNSKLVTSKDIYKNLGRDALRINKKIAEERDLPGSQSVVTVAKLCFPHFPDSLRYVIRKKALMPEKVKVTLGKNIKRYVPKDKCRDYVYQLNSRKSIPRKSTMFFSESISNEIYTDTLINHLVSIGVNTETVEFISKRELGSVLEIISKDPFYKFRTGYHKILRSSL